jgi:hypothetical protein
MPVERIRQPKKKDTGSSADKEATFASTITRKKENIKRPGAIRQTISAPMESAFDREQNNKTLDKESSPLPVIDSDYGRLVYSTEDPRVLEEELGVSMNNYDAFEKALDQKVASGEFTLIEDENSYDPYFEDFEGKQREEAHPYNDSKHAAGFIEDKIEKTTRDHHYLTGKEVPNDNLKTFSDSKTERNNRGLLRRIKDFLSNN